MSETVSSRMAQSWPCVRQMADENRYQGNPTFHFWMISRSMIPFYSRLRVIWGRLGFSGGVARRGGGVRSLCFGDFCGGWALGAGLIVLSGLGTFLMFPSFLGSWVIFLVWAAGRLFGNWYGNSYIPCL